MAALVLHVDVVFILLPICRNFISLLRRTPLNHIIPFDKNITFHKATAWSMVAWTVVHVLAHMVNFVRLALADTDAKTSGQVVAAFLAANFATGPGVTGWIMVLALGAIVFFALEKQRRRHFERFWYSHHLFIVFFVCWQLHGMFCMIQPDRPPYCSFNQIGVFWVSRPSPALHAPDLPVPLPQRYWLVGGVIFVYERILREVRSRHRTYISKVIQHPSKVMEVQIKKEKTTTRAGQYVFLSCPEISYFQWHPFTLTSAPEEDYLSVHIRVAGDFTTAFAAALGCDFEGKEKGGAGAGAGGGKVVGTSASPPINRVLPRVMVDGPFGSASEDFLNYEAVLLVGAGIGVTPFASILKSIWYRMNNFNNQKPTRLSKVRARAAVAWRALTGGAGVLYVGDPRLWDGGVVPLAAARDRGAGHAGPDRDQHLPDGEGEGGRREQHRGAGRGRGEGRDHGAARADALRAAELGQGVPQRAGRAPGHGRGRVLLRAADAVQDVSAFFFFFAWGACCVDGRGRLHEMCNKYTDPKGTKFFFGKGAFFWGGARLC